MLLLPASGFVVVSIHPPLFFEFSNIFLIYLLPVAHHLLPVIPLSRLQMRGCPTSLPLVPTTVRCATMPGRLATPDTHRPLLPDTHCPSFPIPSRLQSACNREAAWPHPTRHPLLPNVHCPSFPTPVFATTRPQGHTPHPVSILHSFSDVFSIQIGPRHVALCSTPVACHSPPPQMRGRPATPPVSILHVISPFLMFFQSKQGPDTLLPDAHHRVIPHSLSLAATRPPSHTQ
jgi:hypothetical protein